MNMRVLERLKVTHQPVVQGSIRTGDFTYFRVDYVVKSMKPSIDEGFNLQYGRHRFTRSGLWLVNHQVIIAQLIHCPWGKACVEDAMYPELLPEMSDTRHSHGIQTTK